MGNGEFVRRAIRWTAGRGLLNWMPDEPFLKLKYWACLGKKLNLDNPKTYNEKLQWLKLHDHKPEYSKMVDKYEAKKYVADRIGEQYIIPTLGVWDRFEDIDFARLPNQFVLKCTHDSGGLVICRDKASLDIVAARKKINRSLEKNYYLQSREWPYKNVIPRVIAEQYMEDTETGELKDYKVWCFNGVPKMILVCTGRFSPSGLKEDFYDCEWHHLECHRSLHKQSESEIQKPAVLEDMLKQAAALATGLPFSRIDFYQVSSQLKFGEITFFPSSGFQNFVPEQFDAILGDWLSVK